MGNNMDIQINPEIQKRILLDEIQILKNTMYLVSVRARASRLVGDEQGEQIMKKEVENILKKIDFIQKEFEMVSGVSQNTTEH